MTDHTHERLGFREIDDQGKAVRAVSPHAPEPLDAPKKRLSVNPFIVALWALDGAMLYFSVWAFTETLRPMVSAPSSDGMPMNFVVLSMLPYLVPASLLITGALLFWHAFQWQRRHGPQGQSGS
ncbi:hypothetical protein ACPFL9_01605 [Paenarthrobacter sp. NyZ202]|uniref:hypothetical protein n=1 Tax=Paenarthrobacter sp. NyZ202 TaxID=3402689 RepID=UPI003CEA6982